MKRIKQKLVRELAKKRIRSERQGSEKVKNTLKEERGGHIID